MSNKLNADKALIFRIVHVGNVPGILEKGMHCRNAAVQIPGYRTIGNRELIEKRQHRDVPLPPGGTLGDYVPFYFTPYSPMMYNIKTGYGGIAKVPNEEIVIFVSSLHRLAELGKAFVFSDRHAYLLTAQFYNELSQLDAVDWKILQQRDFKRDPDDPEKIERYQAEVLVHLHAPIDAMLGLVCYTENTKTYLYHIVNEYGLNVDVHVLRGWYF